MLTASVLDINYCRYLSDSLTESIGNELASRFDYVFVVCYGACLTPHFETTVKNACLIDLSRGAERCFAAFNATSRNEVRKAEKINDLSFQTEIGPDFGTYFDFYRRCEQARNWFPVPESELRNSFVFTALMDGKPFSGMTAYAHNGRLRVGRIFSAKRFLSGGLFNNMLYGVASKTVVYNMIQFAAARGFHTLDLGGVDVTDKLKAGITQFKLSLGGLVTPVTIARYSNSKFSNQISHIRKAGYDIT